VATVQRREKRFRIDSVDEPHTETTSTATVIEAGSLLAGCSTTNGAAAETSTTGGISVNNTAETSSATSSRRRVSKPSLRLRESRAGDLSAASDTAAATQSGGCSTKKGQPKPPLAKQIVD